MRSARLPAVKTLSDFDFSFPPSVKRDQLQSLHTLSRHRHRRQHTPCTSTTAAATTSSPAGRSTSRVGSSTTRATRTTTPFASGSRRPVDGELELLPGLRLVPARGHTQATWTWRSPIVMSGLVVWPHHLGRPRRSFSAVGSQPGGDSKVQVFYAGDDGGARIRCAGWPGVSGRARECGPGCRRSLPGAPRHAQPLHSLPRP
jgi:hypothetical protein